MRSLFVTFLAAVIMGVPLAQSQGRRPQANLSEVSAIEGRVLNGVSGEPLGKASLILRRADMSPNLHSPTSYTASTDESGRFVMRNIEPGQYRLSASRSGFVQMEFGSRGAAQAGVTLSLDAARPLQDIAFPLTPHAVIAGRVRDATGEPAANTQVQVMRYRYIQGRKQLASFGRATTDDLGEYRIAGLAPGQYYVGASVRPPVVFESTIEGSSSQSGNADYVPTYYPGTGEPKLAAPIEVTAGSELSHLDFPLAIGPTVRIRGQVTGPVGGSPGIVTIILAPKDRSNALAGNRTFVTNPQGEFDIRGMTPGAYTLVASVFADGAYTTAKRPLDANSDVDDLDIALTPGLTLSGAVFVEGVAQPDLRSVRVSLLPAHAGEILTPLPNMQVKQDGTFELPNVSPDNYDLAAFELPDGYYVKSMSVGNHDVLDAGLNVNSSTTDTISILLSPGAGQIVGVVQNVQQRAAVGGLVALIPTDDKRRYQMQYYKSVTTDQYGRFLFRNIAPGSYDLFAFENVEDDAFMDPDFMKAVETLGQPILIQENSRTNARLSLIPVLGRPPQK